MLLHVRPQHHGDVVLADAVSRLCRACMGEMGTAGISRVEVIVVDIWAQAGEESWRQPQGRLP